MTQIIAIVGLAVVCGFWMWVQWASGEECKRCSCGNQGQCERKR